MLVASEAEEVISDAAAGCGEVDLIGAGHVGMDSIEFFGRCRWSTEKLTTDQWDAGRSRHKVASVRAPKATISPDAVQPEY